MRKRSIYISFFVNDVFKQYSNIQCSFMKLNLKLKETIKEFTVNIQNGRIIRMSEKNGLSF